ncbi:MAG: hypothetical protein JW819_12555 [Candidatus Krumholzibacteriota bacterium]|nr:hypothetical protein [Candidatus Krumholzibacteriota bacterium]
MSATRPLAAFAAASLAMLLLASAFPPARAGDPNAGVEAVPRFLEYDGNEGILSYEITVRNLGSLPVNHITLATEPESLEGSFALDDLGPEASALRRFTFRIDEGTNLFQPRFLLSYTDSEGERIRPDTGRSPLAASIDFAACDVAEGRVTLHFTLTNPHAEPMLFLELYTENPHLTDGTRFLGDLGPGATLEVDIPFRLPAGERLFNPTCYLRYHAFLTEGTRIHRLFYTLLETDLRQVEQALAKRARDH